MYEKTEGVPCAIVHPSTTTPGKIQKRTRVDPEVRPQKLDFTIESPCETPPIAEASAQPGASGGMTGETPDELSWLRDENAKLIQEKAELEAKVMELEERMLQVHSAETLPGLLGNQADEDMCNDEAARKRLARLCKPRADGSLD